MSETGLIPEVEGAVVAPNQEGTELAAAGTTSGGEIATSEVRDPLEIQNEPELPDLGIEALHSYRSEGPVPEEAAFTGGPTWWGAVGSQEDPVLTLRHRIEV
jgi:hypothetical protein